MQNRVHNFSLVYDFKAGDDYIPNCLNHDTTSVLFKSGGNIEDEVMSDYFKNYIQIPVLKENLNVHWDIFPITTIYDIKQNKKPNQDVYLYAVEPFANIDHILGTENTHSQKPFVEYMSKDALNLLKNPNNKFYCIINFCNEGTINGHLFDYLYNICERYHIPYYKLIFVIACADLEKLHNTYCEEKNIPKNKRIHVKYWTWSIKEKAEEAHDIIKDVNGDKRLNRLTQESSTIVMPSDLELNKDVIRSKRFLMFNRRLRDQRVLFISLFGKKFVEENYISYDFEHCCDDAHPGFFDSRVHEKYQDIGLKNMIDIIENKPKSIIDFEDVYDTVGFGCEDKRPFLDSYIHLTSETNFSEPGVYFSEKTWKPIVNLQPFIMMNYSNSLPYLKELGFKTFSPFIDESYDSILDSSERATKIYEEILRLNNLPIKEIHEWYNSIKPILLHNRDVFMKNHGDVMMDIECKYIESLKSYVNNTYNKQT